MPDNKTDKPVPQKDKPRKEADPVVNGTKEIGGRDGPEPTRYGDWEGSKGGIISDF